MKNSWKIVTVVVVLLVLFSITIFFDALNSKKGGIELYTADAYVPEAESLLSLFHNDTGCKYDPVTSGGSFSDARTISQGKPASLFMSVSLSAYSSEYMGRYAPGWALAFASDHMVIAYGDSVNDNSTAKSIVSDLKNAMSENNSRLFYEAFCNLTSGYVKVGISDPLTDPAGGYAWLVLKIAGYLYASNSSLFVNRMAENHGNVTRSNAAELVSPLEFGDIDFLFIYRSTAISLKLNYLNLPGNLNLGNVSYAGFYGKFNYTYSSETVRGTPIFLYMSIVNNGTFHSESVKFISFLLNNTAILRNFGLAVLHTDIVYGNGSGISPLLWGINHGLIIDGSGG